MSVPRWLVWTLVVLVVLSWVPLALIARARFVTTERPRIHIIQDMDNQPRLEAQARSTAFADRRAMRPQVEGTVARGQLDDDPALHLGKVDDEWVGENPLTVDDGLLARGRERYEVFCAPCHGATGHGDGSVNQRAVKLAEGTWTPPSSFHTDTVRDRADGDLFNTVTNGVRNMPAYGPQIPVEDRWAIVAHVRALQEAESAGAENGEGP